MDLSVSYISREFVGLSFLIWYYWITATETLLKGGISNAEQFIRDKVPSARLLGAHIITADFIANIEGLVLDKISREMWSDMKASQEKKTCVPHPLLPWLSYIRP